MRFNLGNHEQHINPVCLVENAVLTELSLRFKENTIINVIDRSTESNMFHYALAINSKSIHPNYKGRGDYTLSKLIMTLIDSCVNVSKPTKLEFGCFARGPEWEAYPLEDYWLILNIRNIENSVHTLPPMVIREIIMEQEEEYRKVDHE